MFYRSFLPQRKAFCSHHKIPPPETPDLHQCLSPGAPSRREGAECRFMSAQKCHITSNTHTHTYSHTSPLHTALWLPPYFAIYFVSPLAAKEGTYAKRMRERGVYVSATEPMCLNVAAVCAMKCVMCLHIAVEAHQWLRSLEACLTQLQGTERKVIIS